MLDVLSFIFRCIRQLAEVFFSINIGNGLNLGLFMCIIFIFLPVTYLVLGFLKNYLIGETASDIIESHRESRKGGAK